jgi:tRNA-splicing ligase RtcB (3'-phosphate/5'-hydroxy nucleic acid ligase)
MRTEFVLRHHTRTSPCLRIGLFQLLDCLEYPGEFSDLINWACPADIDQPVIIPGSMGSSSFILSGLGLQDSFCSACHGAGRAKARQQGRRTSEEFPCRVVTKIDPRRVRRDIRDDYMKSLMEEAPDKYKDITPVIETVEGAGLARKVARTFPLLTVKGL